MKTKTKTPEEIQKDYNERLVKFHKELRKIQEKHQIRPNVVYQFVWEDTKVYAKDQKES